ncbi:uncharacterized protein LOC108098304 isoform X1 [Drosophila ficusphila]|uniref:uncharacterized protein LOC108098304 isoform X1 n=1 Tax=Drosophila ficusphila TaxID=30025 RepID=UPI0007E77949|nr:uncharacterized protein LOC108098304 isoform X1 [Drosophila ficusphila]
MNRKRCKEINREQIGRQKYSESLNDLLSSLGIQSKSDWLSYMEKIAKNEAANTISSDLDRKCVKMTEQKLSNSTKKWSGLIYQPLADKEYKELNRMHYGVKKLLKQKLLMTDIPEKENLLQTLGEVICRHGPIELISNFVFTMLKMVESMFHVDESMLLIPVERATHGSGFPLIPPSIDEPIILFLDRIRNALKKTRQDDKTVGYLNNDDYKD